MGPVLERVLRLVPEAGSGDTAAPAEIAGLLGMTVDAADQHLARAARAGFVVRIRFGAYELARHPPAPKVRSLKIQAPPTPRAPRPRRFKDPGAPFPSATLTAAQAAIALEAHDETVRRWCRDGLIVTGQLRRWARLRIAPAELRRFLVNCTIAEEAST